MNEKSASVNLELVAKSGLRISVRNLTAEKENQQRLKLAKAKTETIASIPEHARIEQQRAAAAAAEIAELEGLVCLYQSQMATLKGSSREQAAIKLAKAQADLANARWHYRASAAFCQGLRPPAERTALELACVPGKRKPSIAPVRLSSILTRMWLNG